MRHISLAFVLILNLFLATPSFADDPPPSPDPPTQQDPTPPEPPPIEEPEDEDPEWGPYLDPNG